MLLPMITNYVQEINIKVKIEVNFREFTTVDFLRALNILHHIKQTPTKIFFRYGGTYEGKSQTQTYPSR